MKMFLACVILNSLTGQYYPREGKLTTSSSNRSLVWFFVLIFLLSLPIYYLITQLPATLAWILSLLPLPVALIFAFWEGKSAGVKNLLKTYSIKIPNYSWYIPTILLMPAIFLLADRVLGIIRDIPTPVLIVEGLPILIILLLITGSTEEIAWMGYAFDRMEAKLKTLGATLILAIIWVVWHIPAQYLLGMPVIQILSFSIFMIGWRFLIVWIYKNTGKSTFTASLFHAMGNITMFGVILGVLNVEAVGVLGHYILGVVTIITVLIVIFLWGTELNKFRWSR